MRLNKDEVKKIVEGYFKTHLNKNVKFDFCRINGSSAFPCIIENAGTKSTKRVLNIRNIDMVNTKVINELLTKKYSDTTLMDRNLLKDIFLSNGYNDVKFNCCHTADGEFNFSADATVIEIADEIVK